MKDKDREMAKVINAEFSDDDDEEDDNKSNWDDEEKVIRVETIDLYTQCSACLN